jgi:hypothetical protein
MYRANAKDIPESSLRALMLVRVRRPRAVELFANGAIYSLETVRVGRCEWMVG